MDDIRPGQTFQPEGQGTSIPISSPGGATPPPAPSAPAEIPIQPAEPPVPLPSIPEVPSANEAPSIPDSPAVPSAPVSPLADPAPSRSKGRMAIGKFIPWIAGVVLAVLAGGGVYLWHAQQVNALRTEHQSERDVLKSQITSLEQAAKASEAKSSDKEQIKAVLTAECEADVSYKMFEVKDIKVSGAFATASSGCDFKTRTTARANTATLKKVGDDWILIHEGVAQPTTTIRNQFGIPATLYQ